jgi:hypothetical protein
LPEASVAVPRVVELSLKVMVPVGTTEPETCATFVLKVMLVPATAEIDDTARVVAVAMRGTVIVRDEATDVEDAFVLSPLYAAVME